MSGLQFLGRCLRLRGFVIVLLLILILHINLFLSIHTNTLYVWQGLIPDCMLDMWFSLVCDFYINCFYSEGDNDTQYVWYNKIDYPEKTILCKSFWYYIHDKIWILEDNSYTDARNKYYQSNKNCYVFENNISIVRFFIIT